MKILNLEETKRDPNARAAWANKLVYIWSHEHNAYWRANGAGYTRRITDGPGIYDFQDAFEQTRHAGPEKEIQFEEVEP